MLYHIAIITVKITALIITFLLFRALQLHLKLKCMYQVQVGIPRQAHNLQPVVVEARQDAADRAVLVEASGSDHGRTPASHQAV